MKAYGKPATLVSSSAYFLDPEDEGHMFLQNVGDIERTMQRYHPEESTLHNHRALRTPNPT
jgi:hypothetical protein